MVLCGVELSIKVLASRCGREDSRWKGVGLQQSPNIMLIVKVTGNESDEETRHVRVQELSSVLRGRESECAMVRAAVGSGGTQSKTPLAEPTTSPCNARYLGFLNRKEY